MTEAELRAVLPAEHVAAAEDREYQRGWNAAIRHALKRREDMYGDAKPANAEALGEALKVAREALQNIASSGRIVRTVHSDAARTALARIDALIGGNDHEN